MAKKEKAKKPIPIEQQDLTNLGIIANRKKSLREELAEIGLAELAIQSRKEKAKLFNNKTIEMGAELGKMLEQKYGKGILDIDKEVFIPQD